MDEFSWGNTRVVLDDGKDKKIIGDANELKFNESIIPYKKWSGQWYLLATSWRAADCAPEYEAEAYGDGLSSHSLSVEQNPVNPKSLPAPVARRPDSQLPPVYEYQSEAGDYYRDTNAVQDPLARGPMSRPSSRAVSDYNRVAATQRHSVRNVSQDRVTLGSPVSPFGTFPDPRMSRSMSPAVNPVRPMSTFSMATTVFAGPSNNPNPTDEELYGALRTYLSTQDLMTVTKKYAFSFVSFGPSLTTRVEPPARP